MPKLKRLTTFTGALINPVYKNMKQVEMIISPFDERGNNLASHFITMFQNIPEKLKPKNFSFSLNEDKQSQNTYMKVLYVNDWNHKYVLSNHNLQTFRRYLKQTHQSVELDCQLKGLYTIYPEDSKVIYSRK